MDSLHMHLLEAKPHYDQVWAMHLSFSCRFQIRRARSVLNVTFAAVCTYPSCHLAFQGLRATRSPFAVRFCR